MQEKPIIWSAKDLAEALGVNVPPHIKAGKVQFNSKEVQENDIFIALPGKRDGHEFAQEAINGGAACVIISKSLPLIAKERIIQVADTQAALTKLALYKRAKSKAKFVAITGSVGKTSTKEITAKMLANYGPTYSTNKNFNNWLGARLCLASMPDNIVYAVFELGMNKLGEIRELTQLIKPDIAVITAISEGHIEFLGSVEKIIAAKCEIFEGLNPATGIAVINGNMPAYDQCLKYLQQSKIKNIHIFGKHKEANIRFFDYKLLTNQQVEVKFKVGTNIYSLILANLPKHIAYNFTAGLAVVNSLNLPLENALTAVKSFQMLMGRGKLVEINYQQQKLAIICDHYNSNPQSLKAALAYLAQFKTKQKIAVLGDMRELGVMSKKLHKDMVEYIIKAKLVAIFLIGPEMSALGKELANYMQVKTYNNVEELIMAIKQNKEKITAEIMLVKGSNSLKLGQLLTYLGVEDVI